MSARKFSWKTKETKCYTYCVKVAHKFRQYVKCIEALHILCKFVCYFYAIHVNLNTNKIIWGWNNIAFRFFCFSRKFTKIYLDCGVGDQSCINTDRQITFSRALVLIKQSPARVSFLENFLQISLLVLDLNSQKKWKDNFFHF